MSCADCVSLKTGKECREMEDFMFLIPSDESLFCLKDSMWLDRETARKGCPSKIDKKMFKY